MGWQLLIVALIVVVAAVYLLRATWRAWSGAGKGCGGGCCASKEPTPAKTGDLISTDQMLSRLRTQRRATDDR